MKKFKALFTSIILTLFVLNNLMPIMSLAADNTITGNTVGSSEQTKATQESTEQEEIGRVYEIKDEETWDVSKNGDGSVIAKWTLKDRTLTISGSGEMKDWNYDSRVDWHRTKYTNAIEKVVIENGVTNIGYETFDRCRSLTNIEIPNSVTSIGDCAFWDCGSLTNIEIPNSVTSIGEHAFYGCSSLINIEIPNNVTSIGWSAFWGCRSLTNIEIPNSVTSIEDCVFCYCSSLREINVDNDNQKYTSIDGVLYNKNKTELKKYPSAKQNSSYTIPSSVTSIETYAFDGCSSLKNIEIPNSVTSIGGSAFWGCSSLTNIEIPNSVTSIGDCAFWGCSSLTNIEIPNSVTSIEYETFYRCSSLKNIEIPNSVTSIGQSAFEECRSLTNIEIPNSVTSIGKRAFWGCRSLTNIEIPNSVTSIGDYEFSDCSSLTNIEIPNSVTSIGSAFSGCSSLTNIEIPNSVTSIGEDAFSYCSSLTNITIPNSVTSIGDDAFYKCSSLTNIEIPDSVTSIGEKAFYYIKGPMLCNTNSKIHEYLENNKIGYILLDNVESNYGTDYQIKDEETWDVSANEDGSVIAKWTLNDRTLTISGSGKMGTYSYYNYKEVTQNVIIENGVTNIGYETFYRCSSLTNIEIPDSVTSIGEEAFAGCSSLINIEIPDSVTSIGEEAFAGCSSLINIEIPNNVTSIGGGVFSCCSSLKAINVESGNQKYKSMNGVLYNKEGTRLIIYPQGKDSSSFVIPNSVTSIGGGAFEDCSSLTNITIPNSVTSIGNYAFDGCSSLTNIEIPNSVTSIGVYAFEGCSSLTNIEIPNSVTSIGEGAFEDCSSLTNIEIPNSVTSIGWRAFEGCSSLTNIEIPNSVTSIGDDAFYKCSSLTNIEIPDSVTSISWRAFEGCSSLTNIEIPNSVTSIGGGAFEECSSLTNIEIPNSVTSIGACAFEECSSLTNIEIPNSVTSIGACAFEECRSLTNIEIPNSVTSIGKRAFYICSSLTNIEIPDSVTSIGESAFEGCSSLTNIEIPNSVTSIGDDAFKYCNRPVICHTNSEAHRYAENEKIGYMLDEEAPEVNFTPSDLSKPQKEISIKVEVNDYKSGVDESSLKYELSTNDKLSKEEIKTSFETGNTIDLPKGKTETYYLYIYAKDKLENEVFIKQAIILDNTLPELQVSYSEVKMTSKDVTVTITANEEVQEIEGWKMSKDKKVLTKEYERNTATEGEKVVVKDIAGNEVEETIKIANIDKEAPKVTGVQNGRSYSKKATPIVEDENLESLKLVKKEKKQNEEEIIETEVEGYKNGDTITEIGDYKLTATDKIGHITTVEFSIKEIPDTKDVVEVKKSTEEITNQDVVVTIAKKDGEEYKDLKVEVSLDNETYKEQTENTITKTLTENGIIYVRVVKEDIIGEVLEIEVNNIDKTAPTATVTYSTTNPTNQNVTVTITASEEVQAVSGWTLSNNKKVLTKTYTANTTATGEEITIKDLAGNETKALLKITNIDKTAPTATVTYSTTNPTNQNVTVTITANEKIQVVEGWNLSGDGLKLTKTYAENTQTTGEEVTIKDLVGNEAKAKVIITNIDRISPTATITYSNTNLTNQNVTVTITANEKVQQVSGWTLSNDGLKLTKTYTANTSTAGEQVTVKDLAGNETKGTIKIANIDKTAPTATVTYSTTNPTNQNVTVTITANEKVQQVSGWTLSSDGLKLSKTYIVNTTANGQEVTIKDLVGNETKKTIKIANIDKQVPIITGVEKNHRYFRKAKPEITEENIKTIELLKSGKQVTNYTNGQEIKEAGNYKLTVEDKAGNSTTRIFTIYDIETKEYKEQTIGNTNYIGKINVGEKTSQIEKLLKSVESFKITRNGSEIYSNTNRSNDQVLATGDKIEFEDQEYIVIVTGDINKDGKSNIVDLAKCMKVVLGKKQLDTIEGMAADTNFDGKVNIIDLAKIRKLSLNN